eukprot:82852_1
MSVLARIAAKHKERLERKLKKDAERKSQKDVFMKSVNDVSDISELKKKFNQFFEELTLREAASDDDEKQQISEESASTQELIYTRKVSKFPGRKICIIGAGPAGIHMASLLIKQGYTSDQIVLLEKDDRCCGKSFTRPDSDNPNYSQYGAPNTGVPNHYGGHDVVHEMGTCYLHPEYHIISSLAKEYDPTNIEIPFCAGHVFGTKLNAKDAEIEFTDWVLNEIKGKVKENGIPGIPTKYIDKIPHMIAGGAAFEVAIKQYTHIHEEICGKRMQTDQKVRRFPQKPNEEQMKRLNCTFLEFLMKNKLEELIPCLLYSQSMQGYGILDRIPAFYGLLWTTPELLRTTGNILRVAMDASNVIVLSKGYEHLWTQIVLKHKLQIKYNVEVTQIDRDLENNDNKAKQKKIKIKYRQNKKGDDEDAKSDVEEIDADALFIACGCKKALSFLTDAADEEKEIFGCISPSTLTATLFEYDVNPKLPTHKIGGDLWPDLIWNGNEDVYAYRNSLKSIIGVKKYNEFVAQNQLTKDRGIAYQYYTEAPNDQMADKLGKALVSQLSAHGETNVKIVEQKVWDYCPKWTAKDICEKGYPWKVKDELQGKYNKCFYIGSSVCFESVLNVCEYNVELCNSYCFDHDSDIFYCKKRLSGSGPFGTYDSFIGIL